MKFEKGGVYAVETVGGNIHAGRFIERRLEDAEREYVVLEHVAAPQSDRVARAYSATVNDSLSREFQIYTDSIVMQHYLGEYNGGEDSE